MMNGSVQFKAGRGIDDYEVLVAMHTNGSHTFKTALSTKPVNETPAGAHLVHALVPALLAKPLVLAAGSVLTAIQQTAMNEGKAKICPLCGTVSGTTAVTCRVCSYDF
jgi:ribosomal protein L40E